MQKTKRTAIYLLGFLIGVHVALPAYITSSFLGTFVPESAVGAIYSIGSALSIAAIALLPQMLNRFGNFFSILVFILAELVAMVTLASGQTSAAIITAEIVSIISISLLALPLDIFLERYSKETSTGGIRGTYLVFINSAWVISQVVLAIFISGSNYRNIFWIAALALIPVLIIIRFQFDRFRDREYRGNNPLHALASAAKNRNILTVLIVNFLLQFFYSWMVIYSPIYLHQYLGFDWKHIGVMFAVMLLPFALFELPFGKIADRWLGEKEIMSTGFIILSFTTLLMGLSSSRGFVFWTILLFVSRIGASMVEAMSETYFFKQVKDTDLGYISLFRTTRPWANVIAPALATIILPLAGIESLFLVLAFVMAYALRFAFTLKDTK